MTLSTDDIATAANALYDAEKNRQQITPLTLGHPNMDMDDAYAIQKAWVDRKIADGRNVTGYKIGLTSRAMPTLDCPSGSNGSMTATDADSISATMAGVA